MSDEQAARRGPFGEYRGLRLAMYRSPAPTLAHVAALALALWTGGSGTGGAALAEAFDGTHPRIVNGVLTSAHPTVGALLMVGNPADPDGSSNELRCSGTMIGCRTFLTAAHCVCDTVGAECQEGGDGLTVEPAGLRVFLQNAGFFSVARIRINPAYEFEVGGDVALLELATPVAGIAPAVINTTGKPAPGASGTIVGFGRSGGSPATNGDAGLKRAGQVSIAACTAVPSAAHVCWTFADPLGPPGTNSNTCEGDSGGPLFVDIGGAVRVAGVTSGGDSATCLPTDQSFDADVFDNRAWIQSAGGSDLGNTSCGSLPQVGQAGVLLHTATGTLGASQPNARFSYTVPSGAPLLRVALNGEESGGSDFDLYIKAGSPPTTTDYDCRSVRDGQFDFCEVSAPAAATWHVLVERFAGAGTFQLSTTVFSTGSPPQTPSPTPTPPPRAQSKAQQKCITTMNQSGAKVADAQGKVNVACVADTGRGKATDVQGCLASDPKGKVATSKERTAENERRQCATPPDFGFAGTEAVNGAAIDESLALFADIFGGDPNASVLACAQNRTGCQCQSAVAKAAEKILATKLKEFLACKKAALAAGAVDSAALESCITPGGIAADAGGRIERQIAKLASTIGKKCNANVFAGPCAGETLATLSACIDQRVECRACRMLSAMDALGTDCDMFDDGARNGSCAAGGGATPTPTPTPTVPAGQIACGQSINGELSPTDPDLFADGTLADLYAFTLNQTTTVQFSLAASGFEPFVWVGAVDSQTPIFSGTPPKGGSLVGGVYNVVANNAVPVPPGVYPYTLTMTCGGG